MLKAGREDEQIVKSFRSSGDKSFTTGLKESPQVMYPDEEKRVGYQESKHGNYIHQKLLRGGRRSSTHSSEETVTFTLAPRHNLGNSSFSMQEEEDEEVEGGEDGAGNLTGVEFITGEGDRSRVEGEGGVGNEQNSGSSIISDTSGENKTLMDRSEQETNSDQIVRLQLPLRLLRFCPVCGLTLKQDSGSAGSNWESHFSSCVGNNDRKCRPARMPKVSRRVRCATCAGTFVRGKQFEEHSYFCSPTSLLANYNSRRVGTISPPPGPTTTNSLPPFTSSTIPTIRNPSSTSSTITHKSTSSHQLMMRLQDQLQLDITDNNKTPSQLTAVEVKEEGVLEEEGVVVVVEEKEETAGRGPHVLETKTSPPLCCPYCQKIFSKILYLQRHIRVHTGEKPHKCEVCEKSFSDLKSLKNHTKMHTDARPYSCSLCTKKFRRSDSLRYHLNSHGKERPFICAHCAKSFKNKRDLRSHERLSHGVANSEAVVMCDLCNFQCGRLAALKYHKSRVHANRKLECEYCTQVFTSHAQLALHLRTHTGERPFLCRFCSKAFKRTSHLRLHEQRHLGTGQHRCHQCNKTFPQASELVNHAKIHDQVKLNSCPVCGKWFAREDYVRLHLRTHHHQETLTGPSSSTPAAAAVGGGGVVGLTMVVGLEDVGPTGGGLGPPGLSVGSPGVPVGPLGGSVGPLGASVGATGAAAAPSLVVAGQSSGVLTMLPSITVRTEKLKCVGDGGATKTVYVMEPDVRMESSAPDMVDISSTVPCVVQETAGSLMSGNPHQHRQHILTHHVHHSNSQQTKEGGGEGEFVLSALPGISQEQPHVLSEPGQTTNPPQRIRNLSGIKVNQDGSLVLT